MSYVPGEDTQRLQAEFLALDEIGPDLSRVAAILDFEEPFDFRTLGTADPAEVLRVAFGLEGAAATNAIRILAQGQPPDAVVSEFTINGQAVVPAELIDGEIFVPGR